MIIMAVVESTKNNRGEIAALVRYEDNAVPGEPPIPVYDAPFTRDGGYELPSRPTGQVYKATHDANGDPLTYMRRSFISFSFGGREIEDFNLLAYCEGDTMSRNLSAEFEDITVTYNVLDGETYMGTKYQPYTLVLNLVSDNLDQKQLEDFRHWFRGGAIRELILAEHPNRAIMARVSAAPEFNMLPYEKPITMSLDGAIYKTSTTTYRGTITLTLQSEGPYWYSINNIIGEKDGNTYNINMWHGKDYRTDEKTRQDVMKIIYEDGIPLLSMVDETMYFGEEFYAKVQDEKYNLVAEEVENQNDPKLAERPGCFRTSLGEYDIYEPTVEEQALGYKLRYRTGNLWYTGARCEDLEQGYWGRISGSIVAPVGQGISLPPYTADPDHNDIYYFYYPGTAPSPTRISFSIPIKLNRQGYVTSIANAQTGDAKQSNTITVTGLHKKQFEFTTPNVITSYNKVIKYFNQAKEKGQIINGENKNGIYWGDLQDTIRDAIRHPAVRETALAMIWTFWKEADNWEVGETDTIEQTNRISEEQATALISAMAQFWWKYAYDAHYGNALPDGVEAFSYPDEAACFTAHFTFDAYDGTCIGDFEYNVFNVNAQGQQEVVKKTHAKENVGDMIRSNYIFLEDRNVFNESGFVVGWSEQNPNWSHKLTHDLSETISDFKLEYRTMYL